MAAIRILRVLDDEQRRATPSEQRALARYVGWGGLANAFPNPVTGKFHDKWKERGEDLRDLLTKAEYDAASKSTYNAHYTSKTVVSTMWEAAKRLGFKGGLTLESSMGTGNFLGLIPEDMAGGTKFLGVEYDALTARIAAALYPQATVLHSGFQKVPLPSNAFTLAIGNPPFGQTPLRFQFKPELRGVSMHNQFFRASMDAVRPGGLQIMVVTHSLMDAQDKASRLDLAEKAELIGAIRLPDTAFKENARTEVVTDIIFLKKRSQHEQDAMRLAIDAYRSQPGKTDAAEKTRRDLADKVPSWVETRAMKDPLGGATMPVNAYFHDNPAMILGVMERSGSMYHGGGMTVRLDDGKTLPALLDAAIKRLPENVSNIGNDVLATTAERHNSLSGALRIAISGDEPGNLRFEPDGSLHRVIERETPEGDYEFTRQPITADSPWSEQLYMDSKGQWYRQTEALDEEGNKLKVLDDKGKPTKRNDYTREVFATEADIPAGQRLGAPKFERLVDLVRLRDLLKKQLVLETEDANKGVMEANRGKLAKAYKAFVAKHGFVNARSNASLVSGMPDGALVMALEISYKPAISAADSAKSGMEQRAEQATPAPIMSRRVVPKHEPATTANSPADALLITLAERGAVDIERIASLLGVSQEQAIESLQQGEKPLIFKDPETKTWVSANEYLTGLVKRKLNAAKAAELELNVKALEAVQPALWTAENVNATLGAVWVPPETYAKFIEHLTGAEAKVRFSPLTNLFVVSKINFDTSKAKDWSSPGASVGYLVGRLLNSQNIVVMSSDENGKPKRDIELSALAQLKAKEIVGAFNEWVFNEGERRNELVALFNERYNIRNSRQYDGSHLTLPGKVPDEVIEMRRHQLNGVWRGITERFMLYDHAVGAGKTFTAIARAMERRRMGLSKKPMIVVPNHLVDQFTADVYRLYPGAKVLAAGQKDFEAKRRRRVFAKIATGDWDIVIVPHSSFGFIGIAPETEQRFLDEEMAQALQAVRDAEEQAAEDGTDQGRGKPFGVKEAARLVEKIQARMDALNAGTRDKLLTFEQLGIDDMTVDEAHEFKNLYYSSRMTNVRGMGNKTGSRKAADLYNKVRVLAESPTGSVTFMTGTPISNSAVEMYSMMRYLAARELKEAGLEHFDAWRSQYVEASTKFEHTEAGGLKEVNRLGRSWSNMRSLMDLYNSFTDSVSANDIKRWFAEDNDGQKFPVPELAGGKRTLVAVKPTPAQDEALSEILTGFDGLEGIKDPKDRNAERLRLMDRARKVSLDARAVNPRSNSKEEGGKLERVSDEVARIYKANHKDRGTQLVFLDRSVPKSKGDDALIREYDKLKQAREKALAENDEQAFQDVADKMEKYNAAEIEELRLALTGGWNAYQQIKDNLIASGIPAHEIRFVQEADTDAKKKALFDAVNSGQVRVLIGSTPRMGAGTNVQERLVALHHVDVTWKPSDIEQREGRIIRQGNLFATPPTKDKPNPLYRQDFEVEILAYVTERTVDAKMWDLNATKLKTINAIRNYDGSFSMDFNDEDSVSMAEIAALASGNPLLLERVTLESELNSLALLERAHSKKLYALKDAVHAAEQTLKYVPEKIAEAKSRVEKFGRKLTELESSVDKRSVTVEGVRYTKRMDAERAAMESTKAQQGEDGKGRYAVTIDGTRLTNKDAISEAIGAAMGDNTPFEAVVDGKVFTQRLPVVRLIAERVSAEVNKLGRGNKTNFTLGTMLGWSLEVDVEIDKVGQVHVQLSLNEDGRVVVLGDGKAFADSHNMTSSQAQLIIANLGVSIRHKSDSTDVAHLARSLAHAELTLPDSRARLDASQEWPKAGEKKEKLKRLAAVISELSGTSQQAEKAEKAEKTKDETFAAHDAKVKQAGASKQAGAGAAPLMRRAGQTQGSTGQRKADIEAMIAPVVAKWKYGPAGGVEVVQSVADLPEHWQRHIDAVDERDGVEGFFDPKANKVWLVADNLGSMERAEQTLFHEIYGHMGLRAILGNDYDTVLDRFSKGSNAKLKAAADRWMQDNGQSEIAARMDGGMSRQAAQRAVRLLAIEEALSDMAAVPSKMGNVRFLAAHIQRGLRAIGLNRAADWLESMSQSEVLDLLRRARNAVHTGRGVQEGAGQGDAVVFSRKGQGTELDAKDTVSKLTPQLIQDMLEGSKLRKVNGWQRSVGTMFDLAKRNPMFKRVFEAAQDYIGDVAWFANEASNSAPNVLPQANGVGDVWAFMKGNKHLTLPEADRKALAAPVFEGTLAWTRDAKGELVKTDDVEAAGVVFKDAELRQKFGLDARQIGLYREFRKAVNRSLDMALAADLVRYLGKDAPEGAHDLARRGELQALVQMVDAHMDAMPVRNDTEQAKQAEIRAKVKQKTKTVAKLKAKGYAPLSRFGEYHVTVKDDAGDTQFFGMYETAAEAVKANRDLAKSFPGARITRGKMSQEEFKAFKGVSPETLSLFADLMGGDKSEAVQTWLRNATSNRSALRRLIHRKGTQGYSEDVSQVLAAFITSNARAGAQGLHAGRLQERVNDTDGDVKDASYRLAEYVQNPNEEAASFRNFMFLYYLGGSLASAAVNMTQPFTMTLPYLSQSLGAAGAAKVMGKALGMMRGDAVAKDVDLARALHVAEKEGIVSPQELHQLQAMAMGRGSALTSLGRMAGASNKTLGKLDSYGKSALVLWGAPFALAEQFNRRVTFIAAYMAAREKGNPDPFKFAEQAVQETQGIYNRGNRPEWARSALGAILFTFKQYSIAYMEFLGRMMFPPGEPNSEERKAAMQAALFALALLVIVAGVQGLPGAEDLDDLVDTIGQKMGYDTNIKRTKAEWLPAWLQYGLSALLPLDFAGRLSMGNLFPGTGLFREDKMDKSSDVLELFGPAGGLANSLLKASEQGSIRPVLPVAIANMVKGVETGNKGAYLNTKGQKVVDADWVDAGFKFVGFQPTVVAASTRKDSIESMKNNLARNVEASIAAEWAAARADGDMDGERAARARLHKWNKDNPKTHISISMPQILKRVKAIRMTRAERIAKTTPKELR